MEEKTTDTESLTDTLPEATEPEAIEDAPSEAAPAVETPVDDVPATGEMEGLPAEETPMEEIPAEEAPVTEEAPMDDHDHGAMDGISDEPADLSNTTALTTTPSDSNLANALVDISNNTIYLMGLSFILGSLFTILILILLDFMRRNQSK